MIIRSDELEACINGSLGEPHEFLGMHPLADLPGWVVRAWSPGAKKVTLWQKDGSVSYEMKMLDSRGFFEVHLSEITQPFSYYFHSFVKDREEEWKDPYSFLPRVTNLELQGFSQGWDRRPFLKLGAIPCSHDGVKGVSFTIWAPSAKSVHLVGDFNNWNHYSLPMRSLGSSGCRELFLPAANIGDKYKFRVLGIDGILREKTAPFGWQFEPPCGNASIVASRSNCNQNTQIPSIDPMAKPLSIYVDLFDNDLEKNKFIVEKINENFDLSPRGIREMLNLNKPIYEKTSAYGHFGRSPEDDGSFSWEKTDKISFFSK